MTSRISRFALPAIVLGSLWWMAIGAVWLAEAQTPAQGGVPTGQSQEEMRRKSQGCLSCHTPDSATMHASSARIGCTDCHGGDAEPGLPAGVTRESQTFADVKNLAHVKPTLDIWNSSANPQRAFTKTLEESLEFIRFVNPGDLRVVDRTCVPCHTRQVNAVRKSMMAHGAMLWGAALYNNGSVPFKTPRFGEFYTRDGLPGTARMDPPPTQLEEDRQGVLPFLQPLWRWEVTRPGNILRVFERGGRAPYEIGIPDPDEPPGRPANRLGSRGLGTANRTDPVFLGLQKTRLMDPTLNLFGTNEQAGDYRSSGCTACHVVYANDRSIVHAGQYASAGNEGRSQTTDPMIPKTESGHPIRHSFTNSIPTSQCLVCHMHPGTNMVATYLGLTWWDNETDGDRMYPPQSRRLSDIERAAIEMRNPEGSALRGLWSDPQFLAQTGGSQFNATLHNAQFADFHGHGWLFRAVFKRDRRGNLLDASGQIVSGATSRELAAAVSYRSVPPIVSDEDAAAAPPAAPPPPSGVPVHLKDIHLERGMHCVDCHFSQDVHGDGRLYGETRNAVEIDCVDCHGTVRARASLRTSGPASPGHGAGGADLTALVTPFGDPRFSPARATRPIIQRSMITKGLQWSVPQVMDSLDPANPRYNRLAARAKTMRRDGQTWGDATNPDGLAHTESRMTCYACHSSWMTSCFGCHLSQSANQKKPMLHNEGTTTRNWTSYNYQVLRDDVFMLGVDGSVTGNRIAPVRSSSAVIVSSEDLNRQQLYAQQQTVSAEGYAGQAFNTHVPHTVRKTETKTCTDCHVSSERDNNASLAQLLLQGTNFVNFMGRFVYVATGQGGVEAIAVTEREEPQAVIGSDLHKLAYPEAFAAHERRGRQLTESVRHASSNAHSLQARGEYLYIADGPGGFRVFDIAQIHQKGFSARIREAPVSPLGQRMRVMSRFATAVAAPATLAVDPTRAHAPENQEQPIHPMYGYIYVTDRDEGLIVSTAATLLDGNPANNFLERAAAFNPDGLLNGATNLAIAGTYAYILCDRGLVVLDVSDPLKPRLAGQIAPPAIRGGRAVIVQFRYAFVTDADGLKVVDITFPDQPRLVTDATVPMINASGLYVARTYAYVATGEAGLTIVDVERPERPRIDQVFNAGGALNDTRDVKVAMTNASVFAYVADGRNGLRILQLVSANTTPGAFGFSPRPAPTLIATYRTRSPAIAISKGLDRDRAVDESGNQIAVFGRRGARPFNLEEMRRLFLRGKQVWTVTNDGK